MSNTIILNGLAWDKENLEVNSKTYFTYEEAKAEAAKIGKRLPTKSEFEALLQLHHVFDEEKHGMWFAENQADLKSSKSLFLPAAGFSHVSLDYISDVGKNGCYWSDAFYLQTKSAYRLNFNKINNGNMCTLDRNYSYTVRCITNIKQNNMKQEEEKSFKVQIPEGYKIDKENSTFEYIKYKKVKSEYPKSWNEAFVGNNVSGYWVGSSGEIRVANRTALRDDKNTFKYEEQAESALAYAQLTQLMALPCYNGDWEPCWNSDQIKYRIIRCDDTIVVDKVFHNFEFLAFKSEEIRDVFLENHMDLIKQFYQL